MKAKARAAISIQAGSSEHDAGIGQRRDHQAVPVGQHLVVEAGPHAFARAASSSLSRSMASRGLVLASLRGKRLRRLRILWPSKLPSVGHVVMLQQKTQRRPRPAPRRSRPATRRRTCPPRPRNRHRARRENAPSGVVISRASQPTVSARALAEQRVAGRAHRPAPAARAAARCRRASSRNAAPASARRPSSARSRRRDGRRCRPRRCARACARSASKNALRRRVAQPGRARAVRRSRHCGNFGAPRKPPLVGSNAPRDLPRQPVELAARRSSTLPAGRALLGEPLHQRVAVLADLVRLLAEQPRNLAQHIDEGRPAVARGLSGNRCRPRPARPSASGTWSAASRPARPDDAAPYM